MAQDAPRLQPARPERYSFTTPKGIGEKTAADLLQRHGSLEGAIANALRERSPRVIAALRDQADDLLRFKEIATLRHVDVDLPPDRPTDFAAGARAAREQGMNTLAERLDKKSPPGVSVVE